MSNKMITFCRINNNKAHKINNNLEIRILLNSCKKITKMMKTLIYKSKLMKLIKMCKEYISIIYNLKDKKINMTNR